jgi:Fur family transcriptional regulator, peroxide stress response regulator
MEALKTTKEIADYLKDHRVKPSLIRVKVLEYLLSTREHPTADLIFKNLSKEIPTLSKTSIYNTLKIFTSADVAREIMIEENEIRYDAFCGRHGHFKCMKCGALLDVDLTCVSCASSGRMNGNKVLAEHVYMVGICGECAKKQGVKTDGKKIKAGN